MSAKRVLIVATSWDALGDKPGSTGCWLHELVAPALILREKGYGVDIASIRGGEIPLDPKGMQGEYFTAECKRFLEIDELKHAIKNSKAVDSVPTMDAYAGIYIPGGHGIVYDGPTSPGLKRLIEEADAKGYVIASVCHGPVALTTPKKGTGEPLVKDRQVTSFTNEEEAEVGAVKEVQLALGDTLENRLKAEGARFSKGKPWTEHCVTDGKLLTGQNPQSSNALGHALVKALG